jgi:hypothetical protein
MCGVVVLVISPTDAGSELTVGLLLQVAGLAVSDRRSVAVLTCPCVAFPALMLRSPPQSDWWDSKLEWALVSTGVLAVETVVVAGIVAATATVWGTRN